ncbi:hypothetical protein LXA43DRAFT_894362, partial [Ganoderma leucocontextum]
MHREEASTSAQAVKNLQTQVSSLKAQRHNDRRRLQRAKKASETSRQKLRSTEKEQDRAIQSAAAATEREHDTRANTEILLERADLSRSKLQARLSTCLKQVRALEKRCGRFPQVFATHVRCARNAPTLFRLKTKGIYTPQARALARGLVFSGCSQKQVGHIVQMVGKTIGITVKGKMSAHTARRCVVEGGVASDIQLGYEITQANSKSRPSKLEMICTHLAWAAGPRSSPADSPQGAPGPSAMLKNRLLGVESSVNHTSETQVEGWKEKFRQLVNAYNKSPLAQRL